VGFPFRGIRYLDAGLTADGLFPGKGGLGVRRLTLHEALVARAQEVGVDLRWATRATGVTAEGVDTASGSLPGRLVVGADGLRSKVRTWAGLAGPPARQRRFGVRRHFVARPWSDFVEVYWGPECEAYVSPVGPELVGVAVLWSGDRAGFDDHFANFPVLADRLRDAPAASRDRGLGPLEQRVKGVVAGNVALVGDAAGYLDAITGEGLAVAFHESAALVEAVLSNDLGRYTAKWRQINRLPNAMTSLVLALERRPRLRRRALAALAAEPALFSRLLGIHARTLPPRALGLDGALRLAWRLAAA
jgi:flavin-dependent dehydrogenase